MLKFLDNIRMAPKLIGGFVLVALVAVIVGALGIRSITEIADVRLESVDALLVIERESEDIRGTLRTLSIPGIPIEQRQRYFAQLAASREIYEAARAAYEPLPQTPEEERLWNRFVPAWNAWRDLNNEYMTLANQFDRTGIPDPTDLGRLIEQFTKDHYIIVQRTLHLLHAGEPYSGDDDHRTCNLGIFLQEFQSENAAIMRELRELDRPHQRFHAAVGEVQRLVAAGSSTRAREVYQGEMVPAMQQTFQHLENVMGIVNEAVVMTQEAQELLLGPVYAAQDEAKDILADLVALNRDVAHEAGATAKTGMVLAMLIGALAAVGLGVVLARSITGPMNRSVEMVEEMGKGHLDMRLNMGRRDEIGLMADNMDQFADDLQNQVVGALHKIAEGDVSVEVAPKDDQDEIGPALQKTVTTLRELIAEMGTLGQAAVEGRLSTRGDAAKFQGGYREIVAGINATLDAVIEPVEEASAVLQRLADRDLTARVQGDYKGDHARIKEALNGAADNLDEALSEVTQAAEQVASAADQISSGSQTLAEGSSEQASSLEEVSSSLQEMASMTRQNSSNSKEAEGLTEKARVGSDEGLESMQRLSDAIQKIKGSSDSTAKIVKTIDEIAFQTNLLALNAAVEAARAGEAGKGFAVVAEEVRNLAMRSAEAAKSTADLIEEAVANADGGVELNEEVTEKLNGITGQVQRVREVMAEISAASEQQRQGVEQINTAVDQMNSVTQQVAANSEESAGASEELSGQADRMKQMVGAFKLSRVVTSTSRDTVAVRPAQKQANGSNDARRPAAVGAQVGNGGANGPHGSPEDLIPLDDGEDSEVLQQF